MPTTGARDEWPGRRIEKKDLVKVHYGLPVRYGMAILEVWAILASIASSVPTVHRVPLLECTRVLIRTYE